MIHNTGQGGALQAQRVAVVGAGLAGAACAAGLRRRGAQVTVFDKSRNVGGRMATRRARWLDANGVEQAAAFDHGAQCFAADNEGFQAALAIAATAGCVAEWQVPVHTPDGRRTERCWVATPAMPALCSHLLAPLQAQGGGSVDPDANAAANPQLHLNATVQALTRAAEGRWWVAADGLPPFGPFDQVVLAMPPSQAAALLRGHHEAWAAGLAAARMQPCWTLMAVTDAVDWPLYATQPASGPLGWVLRNDLVPGRSAPLGMAVWTAHATAAWTAAHLEAEAAVVKTELQAALQALLAAACPVGVPWPWHHTAVHRWRYAQAETSHARRSAGDLFWWDASLGLGVCGDFLGGSGGSHAEHGVENAWCSGDALSRSMTTR